MAEWKKVSGDIAVWSDRDLVNQAHAAFSDTLPAFETLVPESTKLTSENILSRHAEHGKWWAVEFRDRPYADIDEDFICEVGVYVSWRSESQAPGLTGPGYVAGVSLGYPPRPGSHWPVDEVEDVIVFYTPEMDSAGSRKDEEAVERRLYDMLRDMWANG